MNLFVRACVFAIALPVVSACTVLSTETPIGISSGVSTDARLLGGWKLVSADTGDTGKNYVFVEPREMGGLHATIISWEPLYILDPKEHYRSTFEIVTGRINAYRFINARPLLEKDQPASELTLPKGYFPIRYSFQPNGSIQFFGEIEGTIIAAIENGEVRGTTNDGNIRLMAESQSLDAYFAEAAPSVFSTLLWTLEPLD
nr:MAG: hypothetical protein E4H34_01975 [Hyphomicrobiales bacterium]